MSIGPLGVSRFPVDKAADLLRSAGPQTLAADRYLYALWPLATGCHTID